MGKYLWRTWVLTVSIGVLLTLGARKNAMAGMQLDVHIDLPPLFEIRTPPPMAVIPGTYVYLAPDVKADIFFYHGYWYRPHRGRWYRASSYNGGWAPLAPRYVPRALTQLPPRYRSLPRGYHRIPYGEVRRDWRKWEHEKRWNRDRAWQEGWKRNREYERTKYSHERERQRERNRATYTHEREQKRRSESVKYAHGSKPQRKPSVHEQTAENERRQGSGNMHGNDKHKKTDGKTE